MKYFEVFINLRSGRLSTVTVQMLLSTPSVKVESPYTGLGGRVSRTLIPWVCSLASASSSPKVFGLESAESSDLGRLIPVTHLLLGR